MPKSNLDSDGDARLKKVIKLANGDVDAVGKAVSEVLMDLRGKHNHGRWVYLRNELTRRAKRHIRSHKSQVELVMFVISPGKILDAWRHEQALLHGVPEHDR